jgi:DNA-binding LacI/PurR family transcriptional regulator
MDTASQAVSSISDESSTPTGSGAAVDSATTSCADTLLGLIVPELANSCVTAFFRQFEDAAALQGCDLLIGTAAADRNGTEPLVRHMIQRGVKGVAVLTDILDRPLVDSFLQHDIHLILLAPAQRFTRADSIEVDVGDCANQAVQHLAVLGHRNIVFAQSRTSFLEVPPGAFSLAMSDIGVQVGRAPILREPVDCNAGPGLLPQLLSLPMLPTGIVCSGDMVALKLMRALQANGFKVPEDISIIGFGDLPLGRVVGPPLTTVQISQRDLIDCASDFLRSIQNPRGNTPAGAHRIGATLIARQSTSFPRTAIQRHLASRLARKASRKI